MSRTGPTRTKLDVNYGRKWSMLISIVVSVCNLKWPPAPGIYLIILHPKSLNKISKINKTNKKKTTNDMSKANQPAFTSGRYQAYTVNYQNSGALKA